MDAQNVMFGVEVEVSEHADAYQAAFGLSMLSRYFPDYWITCLESRRAAAGLIDRFTQLYVEKLPVAALGLFRGERVVFSTHPVPMGT